MGRGSPHLSGGAVHQGTARRLGHRGHFEGERARLAERSAIELGRETWLGIAVVDFELLKEQLPKARFVDSGPGRVGLPADQVGVGNRLHAPSLRDRRRWLGSGPSRICAPALPPLTVQKNVLRYYIEGGADLNSEPPTVLGATGPNRTFQKGDVLYIDGGCNCSGYKMDFARRAVFGPPSARQQSEHDGMWGILNEIIERMKPGVSMRELFEYSQGRLAQHPEWRNYSDHPSKRIGHGIGLENEPPSISATDDTVLEVAHGADAGAENRKRRRPAKSGGTCRHPSVGLRDPFRQIGLADSISSPDRNRSMKIRLLSEKNVRSVAPTPPEVVALVEQAYRLDAEGKVEVPTKIGVHPERANTFLHAMPAWVGGARALGMKWVSYFPGNFDRGLPDSTGIIILNDPEHGLPCCIMEGMYVTFLRTAACAAVAAKYLAPRPPKTLGLIGCGGLGLLVPAHHDRDVSLYRTGIRVVADPPLSRRVLREDDAGGKLDDHPG